MNYNKELIRSRTLDYSNQGFVITDPNQPDNPVIDVNNAFIKMTGYELSEIIGRNCRFLQADDQDQAGITEIRDAIANRSSCSVLLRNYRKDGTMFWNELNVSPVFDEDGTLIYFVGIQQDVTQKQDLLQELKITNDNLRAVNELMVDRELKMVKLKEEIQLLKAAK